MGGIQLGNIVRDRVTGFEGKVVAVTEWLFGDRRIAVQALQLKDGKPIELVHYSEDQLQLAPAETPTV